MKELRLAKLSEDIATSEDVWHLNGSAVVEGGEIITAKNGYCYTAVGSGLLQFTLTDIVDYLQFVVVKGSVSPLAYFGVNGFSYLINGRRYNMSCVLSVANTAETFIVTIKRIEEKLFSVTKEVIL